MIILGSGPNRIGQGIEFDYACVHASFELAAAGFETVMVNCNPETVSTDYDTADRLYFEPLTLEDVLEVVHAEQATAARRGRDRAARRPDAAGPRPQALKDAGVPVVGTSPESIHLAEERGAFGRVLAEAGLPAPRHGTRPVGGRGPRHRRGDRLPGPGPAQLCPGRRRDGHRVRGRHAHHVHEQGRDRPPGAHRQVPRRRHRDRRRRPVRRRGALPRRRHGAHRGGRHPLRRLGLRAAPITLGSHDIKRIRTATEAIARGVGVRGLLNVQYALAANVLYVLEANPRASRTIPFVSKATAVPLAKAAARVMMGATIAGLREEGMLPSSGDGGTLPMDSPIAVKEAVLPFDRFRGVDIVLGPEMRSTGEVMGIDAGFGSAYAKSQQAAYGGLPTKGRAFVSVANKDKRAMIFPVKALAELGFEILATEGTAEVLRRNGVHAKIVRKQSDGPGADGEPTIVRRILDGEVDLIVNTPFGSPGQSGPRLDGYEIRTAAVLRGIACITTVQGLAAAVQGIQHIVRGDVGVRSLQEHAQRLRG